MSDIERDFAALARLRAAQRDVLDMPLGRDRELALLEVMRALDELNHRLEPDEPDLSAEQMPADFDAIDIATRAANLSRARMPAPVTYLLPAQDSPAIATSQTSSSVTVRAAAASSSTSTAAQASATAPPPRTFINMGPSQYLITFKGKPGMQDTRPNAKLFHTGTSRLLDVSTALAGVDLTICELLTFFPLHYIWDGFQLRCHAAGWKSMDVAKYMLRSRSLESSGKVKSERLRSTIGKNLGLVNKSLRGSFPFSATTNNWRYLGADRTFETDCELLRLAYGVARLPTGSDRGLLTVAIEHAQQKQHGKVMLSELSLYVRQWKLVVPSKVLTRDDDKQALKDFRA